jgi:hypothetical protein
MVPSAQALGVAVQKNASVSQQLYTETAANN